MHCVSRIIVSANLDCVSTLWSNVYPTHPNQLRRLKRIQCIRRGEVFRSPQVGGRDEGAGCVLCKSWVAEPVAATTGPSATRSQGLLCVRVDIIFIRKQLGNPKVMRQLVRREEPRQPAPRRLEEGLPKSCWRKPCRPRQAHYVGKRPEMFRTPFILRCLDRRRISEGVCREEATIAEAS